MLLLMATSQVAHFNSQDTQSWRSIFLTPLHLHAKAVRCILGCCKKRNPLGRFSSMPSLTLVSSHKPATSHQWNQHRNVENNHINTFSIHNLLFTYLLQLQVCWQKTISVLSLAACHFSLCWRYCLLLPFLTTLATRASWVSTEPWFSCWSILPHDSQG